MKAPRLRRHPRRVPPTTFHPRDLMAEAVAGMVQRPGRTALTMLGTVLGVGAFVAVLGLTATADGQIGQQFTNLEATTVTVDDVGAAQTTVEGENPAIDFPSNADERISALRGVIAGGTYWTVPLPAAVISRSPDATASTDNAGQLSIYAASPGALQAMQPTLQSGVLYNAFHQSRADHVAVLGTGAARVLGITNLATRPAVFVDGTAFTVVGIINTTQLLPETLLGVMIPSSAALALYGPPEPFTPEGGGAHMLIHTDLGAADLIAAQAPLALLPTGPQLLAATAPPNPQSLRNAVTNDLSSLFLLLAAICLIVGAVGIANTTLIGVLERTGEIGLRRALGARRRHIATQFLAESTTLGTLGGLLGTTIGVGLVVTVSLARHWTALLNPLTVLAAPLIGSVVGLAAGLYPAIRAAWTEPLEALRR
jgi:putative ABC transport system permease protein